MNYTDKQLRDYVAYERVRKGGRYNMLDPRAQRAAGLNHEEYMFVLNNFSSLRAAHEASKAK